MSQCASCGLDLRADVGLCPHHGLEGGRDWAAANRIMCDFIHRQRVPRHLAEVERHDAVIDLLQITGAFGE